jgi:hypothetical protein
LPLLAVFAGRERRTSRRDSPLPAGSFPLRREAP